MNHRRRKVDSAAGRRLVRAAALSVSLLLTASAHVGTRNVVFQGDAGPYPVTVVIRPPEVVPGLAAISVRIEADAHDRDGVERVTVQPVRWDAGPETGAPRPDEANPVPGVSGLYAADLWLMTSGAYRVTVSIEGALGTGEVVVPVTSTASGVLGMPRGLGWVLTALGLFLFAGAITLFGAATRESVLSPGEAPGLRQRRRGWLAMAIGGIVLAVTAFGGKAWWDAVDAAARSGIYRPLEVEAEATIVRGAPVLDIAITDERWLGREYSPLVPDHGKLMHLFVVGAPGMDAFAHVHPVPIDSATFRVAWPPLPAGEYRIYGDVVHETGFAETVVDTVVVGPGVAGFVPNGSGPAPSGGGGTSGVIADPDDSWWTGAPIVSDDSRAAADSGDSAVAIATLDDGTTITWVRDGGPLRVDAETTLRFEIRGGEGEDAILEPYMGMLSHAAITRDDGSVFVHLHPTGTISMGSLSVLERRAAGDTTLRRVIPRDTTASFQFMRPEAGGPMVPESASGAMTGIGTVSIPFAFPRAGDYTIWVQVKVDGRVRTAAFQTTIG